MVIAKDILKILNTFAPFDLSEEWDNCGLQAGNINWKAQKVMIGLDVSLPLLAAAKEWGADMVLTHHPLILSPQKILDFSQMPGSAVEIAARHRISIVAAHTNLDKAYEGLNDYFAAKIGVTDTHVLLPDQDAVEHLGRPAGVGRVGSFRPETKLDALCAHIKSRLNLPYIRVTGQMDSPVRTVAICTGSGASLLNAFFLSQADVYITGDMKYHDARLIEEKSKALIDVGHFGSEHMAVDLLFGKLEAAALDAGLKIEIKKFEKEKDPFIII